MRYTYFAVVSLAATLAYTSGSPTQIPPGFTEIIEINFTLGPEEVFDFVFVDEAGGVTQVSVGDPDGDGVIITNVPPQTLGVYVHLASDCLFYCLDVEVLSAGSGMVPLIEEPTGLSLLPLFLVADLDQMPPLLIGQTFEVVNGVAPEYGVATIRAPGVPFVLIPPSQWADPANNFPLYTGTAFVSELLDVTVSVICPQCPWDCADCDGVVAVPDLLALLGAWGGPQTPGTTCDLDGSGAIAVPDLLKLLANWGPCPE